MRPTVTQRLADEGTSESLLQKLLGHEHLQTKHFYYQPSHTQVKTAMESDVTCGRYLWRMLKANGFDWARAHSTPCGIAHVEASGPV